MADNSNLKSPKSTDKPKLTNVIHRTTSESLRLGESENVLNSAGVTQQIIPPIPANNQRAKKPCSFQITSVIVGRMNNDGGDDSADDLDESHADDNSDVIDNSRITDNETPSFSEDTFSKEDIVFNVSNSSLCSAPVIPTSSQYGLAIVSPGSAGNPAIGGGTIGNPITGGPVNAIDVNVTVVNQANVVVDHVNPVKLHEQENKDMQSNPSRNDRFKVVKIESTEPFKRGRWTCMDFLDSANQQFTQMQPTSRVEGSTNANAVGGQYISESAAMTDFRSEQIGPNVNIPIGSNFLQQTQNVLSQQIPVQGNQVQGSQVHMPMSQAQYYNPQQVQGQTNIAHMQSTQQSINTQYSQQSSIQQPIPQTQYPVQQSTHQQQQPISMPGMIVQPGVPTSMAGAYGVAHQSVVQQGPIQPVSHNVVQGTQGQISQLGIVQSQVLPQQNIVQQGQTQNSSSVVSQVPYNQGSSNFTPTSSSVIPSQYLAQNQTFSTQSSQQHIIPQQSVGSMYNAQGVASNVSAQGQSYSGSQVQQNIQGQSYSNPLTQIVGNSLSSQGQSYAGQLSQTVTSNVPTQAQSYAGHTTQSTAGNVSTQAQSYIGQPSQIVGSVPPAQGQSYSQPSLPSNIVQGQGQSFANQQTQTTYAQSVMNQPYVQQPQQQSNVQQGQNFHGQSQAQTYVSQQQSSYPGVASNQIYSQNVTSMTNVPQSQNYGVSIPSSPATVPQQPIYPTSTQGANAEQPQTYSQPQNYVPTSATGTHEHILTNVGNFPSQGQSYSTVGIVQQSTYPASQQNVPVQSNYRYGTQQSRTSSTYTSSQFKGHSSAQCDEPSPSEIPVSIPVEPSVDTSTVTEENTIPVDDADNAAGNSAVAIDNKIEQAMDLVKSHLMFAVREEVEVLKEKIAELMDRINQLETENSILKAHATQETLAQLNNPTSNGHSQSPATQTISPGSGQQGGST